MNANDATRFIVDDSGIGVRELRRTVGNLSRILYGSGNPSVPLLARIADACGYDLLLRRRIDNHEVLIDGIDD